ncbi:hypothetical protein Bca52824_073930 [Brassica carinata]|uniref:Uncharacterized protein n=1 Tax=Brassica carinata TaxID=52824 RepID=A0A8X7U777_BRACI|nr:hypothetical protein Bca52824_073930 [Brassica carinata]
MNSDLPASFVGGRVRPCRLQAIPMAPLKQRERFTLDDGLRSKIREGGLKAIQKKYGIHSSVHMRSPSEFKRAPDGGPGEIAIYEVYLVAGFRGIVPSLVAEVSSFFGFCPFQLTPLSWKILMSIQVLGELHGLETGIHEVLYSYHFAPCRIVPWFYHLQPRDGAPLVEEPRRDVSRPVSFLGEVVAKKMLMISRRFRGCILPSGNIQAGTQRRCPFYAPPPRLTKMPPLDMGAGRFPYGNMIGDVPLAGIQQWVLNELFSLRNRVSDMAAQRDLLIQQVRASSRWELMKEWLEIRREHWDPSEEADAPTRLADASLRVGPESAAESRVLAGPPF